MFLQTGDHRNPAVGGLGESSIPDSSCGRPAELGLPAEFLKPQTLHNLSGSSLGAVKIFEVGGGESEAASGGRLAAREVVRLAFGWSLVGF